MFLAYFVVVVTAFQVSYNISEIKTGGISLFQLSYNL